MRISIDANALVFLIDRDAGERHKRALEMLDGASIADCVLTLQIPGDFFPRGDTQGQAVCGWRVPLSDRLARGVPVHAAATTVLDEALDAVRSHHLSFWDAMLWATMQQAGCELLLTEDFQDGHKLGRVTFVNPFAPANQALLDRELPRPIA